MDSDHPTTDETLKVEYAIDGKDATDDDYTDIVNTKTSSGEVIYKLPNSTTPNGVSFRSIKFRVTWARGSTTGNAADLIRLVLVYRRSNINLPGYQVNIEIKDTSRGKSASQKVADIESARENETLIPFSYRDSATPDYVQLIGFELVQANAGHDYEGTYSLTFAKLV